MLDGTASPGRTAISLSGAQGVLAHDVLITRGNTKDLLGTRPAGAQPRNHDGHIRVGDQDPFRPRWGFTRRPTPARRVIRCP